MMSRGISARREPHGADAASDADAGPFVWCRTSAALLEQTAKVGVLEQGLPRLGRGNPFLSCWLVDGDRAAGEFAQLAVA